MLIDPTMREVLRHFYPKYLDSYTPTERQAKTVHHILNCKTGAYGMNVSKCGLTHKMKMYWTLTIITLYLPVQAN